MLDQSTESPTQYLQRGWVNGRADHSTESSAQYLQRRWINERPVQSTEDAAQYSRRRTINGRPGQHNRSSNLESSDIKLPPFNGKENWNVWINSLAQEICTLWFQFFGAVFASKGYPFQNIFGFPTAGDWDCVAAVERLPAPHFSEDFIFLSFGIMGFIVEL